MELDGVVLHTRTKARSAWAAHPWPICRPAAYWLTTSYALSYALFERHAQHDLSTVGPA